MRYEDTQIFESYRLATVRSVPSEELITEGWFLPLLGIIGVPIMAWISGSTGLTDKVANIFEKAFGFNPFDLLEIPGLNLIKWIEPTGVTNWGDVSKFQKIYEANPTEENKWKVYEAVFYTVPVIGKYSKVLAGIAKSGRTSFKSVPWLYKLPVWAINRGLTTAFKNPKIRQICVRWIKAHPVEVQRVIAGVLGASLMRMLGIRLATTGVIELEKDAQDTLADAESATTPGSTEPGSGEGGAADLMASIPDIVKRDIERIKLV